MKLNPYLHFDGNCREALSFYQECLGGAAEFQTVGQSPLAEGLPAETHDRVLPRRWSSARSRSWPPT